jgi:hypothetical protein
MTDPPSIHEHLAAERERLQGLRRRGLVLAHHHVEAVLREVPGLLERHATGMRTGLKAHREDDPWAPAWAAALAGRTGVPVGRRRALIRRVADDPVARQLAEGVADPDAWAAKMAGA